jgi:hypothetical protein
MKSHTKYPVIAAVLLAMGGLVLEILNASAASAKASTQTFPPARHAVGVIPVTLVRTLAAAQVPMVVLPLGNASVLNARRQFALGMIETGNKDSVVGRAGEVSRYQIMPGVWHQYSDASSYEDPAASLTVAQQHWLTLYTGFKHQTHREPTDFDMYVLWNTRYGYYANRGFDSRRLSAVVQDRAQRFVNLVESGP